MELIEFYQPVQMYKGLCEDLMWTSSLYFLFIFLLLAFLIWYVSLTHSKTVAAIQEITYVWARLQSKRKIPFAQLSYDRTHTETNHCDGGGGMSRTDFLDLSCAVLSIYLTRSQSIRLEENRTIVLRISILLSIIYPMYAYWSSMLILNLKL